MEKCYCTKSELDLFTSSPIQLAIDRSSFVEIHPVASISDNNTIEFLISGLGESYFDLSHLFLHVQARILKGNGEAFQNDDKCGPINYLLNTMFAECHISLNDRQISSENNYAYKAYIQSMLFHSESSQKNLLSAGLFVKDTAGKFDDVTLTDAGLNKGLRKRWDRVKNGKVFDMCGILHTDIGTQSKLLINGTSIRIRLIKAKNEFSLLAATGDYRLQIENISIYVRKCEISSSILVAHEKALEQSLIQMPFTRIEVKTFTVSSGLKSVIIPNGVNGVLPSRIMLGLISNSAFNGDMKKNPFNFKHYNLNHISLSENGIQIPTTAYTPDYAKDLYARNYLSLFTDLAQHKTNVSYDDYKENICLYVFDLTQDKSASEPFGNVTRSGDISIHLKFDAELPETATLIAYMEMPSLIEIDKSRNVFIDY
ncbi:uncharacterized protein F54H12.2 [Trichonephila clavipes]|uniref:Uncharacterized protein F54H12.2 n=3 Tax=Trichonephila clavipes TaxID=2585209 RepID=A0A8X6WK25_TRICX|nr:uncharacterized protein F54H12.2 [Trichonephila clavipes]GFV94489.1 uncharacterized protein F54H12.2 [Trichonephila clavipes]GFX70669.1 uncharacterized protein F54H12.2 [Trichonephila clavipes]GFY36365.1 uncharacterized protein F54H12.2 [Trichonephila clavipes]